MPSPETDPRSDPDARTDRGPRVDPRPPTTPTAALLAHFDANRRAMPWRETDDPYAIWVSEVMLQQTRVETVIPYWERWIDRFPTVDALADAELDEVLKHWEGLGYYSRARNLHSAAGVVRERFGGQVPSHPADLRELPGVGAYTAGAVASIAFGVATPAVDGNVRRVLSRLHDLEAPTAAELRDLAAALVPADRPGDFNQALMELGATICTPRSPDCSVCPLAEWCEARRLGVQEQRPRPPKRKTIPQEEVRTIVAVRDDGALLLTRRPEDGLLGGLWEFPGEPLPEAVEALIGRAPAGSVGDGGPDSADGGVSPEPESALRPVTHTFSHKRVTYRPELLRVAGGARSSTMPDTNDAGRIVRWVTPAELDDYALPVAQQKIARQILTLLQKPPRARPSAAP